MALIRQHKFQNNVRTAKAQQFMEGLLDEIRFNNEINLFWIKYRYEVILPVNYERVSYRGNENNWEFKKLKDFILHYEEQWLMEWQKKNP